MEGISPDAPNASTLEGWFDDCQADVMIVGHTHMACVRRVGQSKLVVNPGALLRDPATPPEVPMILDSKTGKFVKGSVELGTFGVFDTVRRTFAIERVVR